MVKKACLGTATMTGFFFHRGSYYPGAGRSKLLTSLHVCVYISLRYQNTLIFVGKMRVSFASLIFHQKNDSVFENVLAYIHVAGVLTTSLD